MRELDNAIEALKLCPTVNIKGKQYSQVATRVEVFRKYFGCEWGLTTELLPAEHPFVRARAEIRNPEGRVIATGMAQENTTLGINRTSAIENCETSAIGRALANLGLHGGEYATAEEVDTAIKGQQQMEETADNKAKTKLQSDMNAFDRELQRVSDTAELAGLLKSYDKTLVAAMKRADMRTWWDGDGGDVMGAAARIDAKRKELEAAEREGPQEPRGSPQKIITILRPEGGSREFPATNRGALEALSDLEQQCAINPDAWQANREMILHMAQKSKSDEVKKRALALENEMEAPALMP